MLATGIVILIFVLAVVFMSIGVQRRKRAYSPHPTGQDSPGQETPQASVKGFPLTRP